MIRRPKLTAAPETAQSVEGAVRRSGPDPAKTYHGGPCKNCAETLRWRIDRSCVACKRLRYRDRYATEPEFAERGRGRAKKQYYGLDHIALYSDRLRIRRFKALKRKEARHGSLSDEG